MTSIPAVIRSQIELGVLMSLGATDLMTDKVHADSPGPDSLTFRARILPSKTAGRARVMRVTITLDPSDTYSIKVGYAGTRRQGYAWQEHKSFEHVYCDSLNRVLLSLDQVI
jgi:hypothetical protein